MSIAPIVLLSDGIGGGVERDMAVEGGDVSRFRRSYYM